MISPWMGIVAREVEFCPHPLRRPSMRSSRPITSRSSRSPATDDSDRAAIPSRHRGLLVGVAGRHGRPRRDAGRMLPARAARGDRADGSAVHDLGEASPCTGRLSNRIHSFFVEAGERSRRVPAGAGPHGQAGFSSGDRAADPGRRFRVATPPRCAAACRAARVSSLPRPARTHRPAGCDEHRRERDDRRCVSKVGDERRLLHPSPRYAVRSWKRAMRSTAAVSAAVAG